MRHKHAVAFSILLTSCLTAHAGCRTPKPEPVVRTASDVYLASPAYTFGVEFAAMFLKPSTSNLHYAAEADPLPVTTPNWKIHNIHTDYDFGFDLGLEGISHCSNTNLTLNWQRFHANDSSSKTLGATDMIGPFFEIGPDAAPYKEANGRVRHEFDAVNLDFGQFVSFGKRLRARMFAGLTFARIYQKRSTTYSNLTGTIFRNISTPSRFVGAGPQVGFSFNYGMVEGLQLIGGTSASMYVGGMKNHTNYQTTSPALAGLGVTAPNSQSTKEKSTTQVVPGFAGNIGLAYNLDYCKHYNFRFEVGYEAQIYLNAIQSTDIGSEVITPPVTPNTVGVYARTFDKNLSNFALSGPYLLVNFGF